LCSVIIVIVMVKTCNIVSSLVIALSALCFGANAQDLNFDENVRRLIESGGRNARLLEDSLLQHPDSLHSRVAVADTVPERSVDTQPVIRYRPLKMSEEALYWSRYARSTRVITSDMTYRDLLIASPLFMPVLFRPGKVMPYDSIKIFEPDTQLFNKPKPLIEPVSLFKREVLKLKLLEGAYRYIQYHNIDDFRYIISQLPTERTLFIAEKGKPVIQAPAEQVEVNPTELPALPKFIPDRRYWTSSFSSSVQFSQNYVSPNWAGGGASNLNVIANNLLKYNYAKDKVLFNNTLEINASVYNAPKDTLRDYKIGSDLLHYNASFGYRAFSKWYYTLVSDFRTQMFTNYQENTTIKQAALLSPFIVTVEPGMKYDLAKTYARKDRSLTVTLNVSPFSFKYMYSADADIDLGRHGFKKDDDGNFEHTYSEFGSTVRYNMVVKPNRNVVWTSNFSYFTSYSHVISTFDNILDLAISRYFSTRITLNLRYDDGVARTPDYDSYLQLNEVLSFGFRYMW